MPLSPALYALPLTRPCPHCGHGLTRAGHWFRAVTRYRCPGCGQQVRLTYRDKLGLFGDHAHLAPRPAARAAPALHATAVEVCRLGLAHAGEAIARAERVVGRQSRVVAVVTRAGLDPGPALVLLAAMQRHLAEIRVWRARLLADLGEG